MEQINLTFIDTEKTKLDKKNKLFDDSALMGQFLLIQNNIFKFIKNFSSYEFCLWLKFMNFYILNKNSYSKISYKKGDILYIEFGTNVGGELSYMHPCVVIEKKQSNIFVVPCSSSKINKVFNKKTGSIYEEYIIAEKADGFTKDTVLMLDNVKWVSKTRVVGKMGTASKELMKKIYSQSFKYNYEHQFYMLKKLEKIEEKSNEKIEELNNEIEELNKKVKELEEIIL